MKSAGRRHCAAVCQDAGARSGHRDTQGGFMPPSDQLCKHDYRDEMGAICSQIAALF